MSQTLSSREDVTRVIIADEWAIARQPMRTALAQIPGAILLGETASLTEALHWAQTRQPDVVVLGRNLVGDRAAEILRALMHTAPAVQIVFIGEPPVADRDSAVASGAASMPSVDQAPLAARPSVRAERPSLAATGALPTAVRRVDRSRLSPRERDVLRMVACGLSSKDIAMRLQLSIRTIENHRARIARRTGLRSVAQLTVHAIKLGLIDAPLDDVSKRAS